MGLGTLERRLTVGELPIYQQKSERAISHRGIGAGARQTRAVYKGVDILARIAGISPRLKNALEPLEGLAQFLVSLLYHETLDFIGRD